MCRLACRCIQYSVVLVLAAFSNHARVLADTSRQQAEELKMAINADYRPSLTNWDRAILNDTVSNLKLERILWSNKPPRFKFTVFTQLTVDRLPTLFNMCTAFNGPLSAAVYIGLVQPALGTADGLGQPQLNLSPVNAAKLSDAVRQVESVHSRVEAAADICQLDVMLFYELFDSPQSALLYPVNYLRNYARMQVRTRLLAMIDVDMLISSSLSEELSRPDSVTRYEAQCEQRRATVLPAFEPTRPGWVGRGMADKIARVTKSQLASIHGRNKEAMQFKLRVFPRGHTPTDYRRWFETSEPYQVAYRRFYEPWFITCDEIMPFYDIGYRGYGMNKIILIASLNTYNYTFWVHPGAWLVHNPHGDTDVRKMVAREASDVNKLRVKLPANALYRKLTVLFGVDKRRMMAGSYNARVDARMMAVYERVPWLRRPPVLVGNPTPESVFVL